MRVRYERLFGKQEEWVEPGREPWHYRKLTRAPTPLRVKLVAGRSFIIACRLEPEDPNQLVDLARAAARASAHELPDLHSLDKALYISGWSYGWTGKMAAYAFVKWLQDQDTMNEIGIVGGAIRALR